MNTKVSYLYRDASNYKMQNEAIVAGPITEHQIDIIMDCLDSGEYFIPKQVGLPEERFGEWTEDDHCWFELSREGFEATELEDTAGLSVDELVSNFMEAKGNWNDTEVHCEKD